LTESNLTTTQASSPDREQIDGSPKTTDQGTNGAPEQTVSFQNQLQGPLLPSSIPTAPGSEPFEPPLMEPMISTPVSVQSMMPQPQLFLQYFTPDYLPGKNGYGVALPVGFVPPQPRSASSTATLQVTSPEKVPLPVAKE